MGGAGPGLGRVWARRGRNWRARQWAAQNHLLTACLPALRAGPALSPSQLSNPAPAALCPKDCPTNEVPNADKAPDANQRTTHVTLFLLSSLPFFPESAAPHMLAFWLSHPGAHMHTRAALLFSSIGGHTCQANQAARQLSAFTQCAQAWATKKWRTLRKKPAS